MEINGQLLPLNNLTNEENIKKLNSLSKSNNNDFCNPMLIIERFQIFFKEFLIKYKQVLFGILKIGFILFYHIFLVFALLHDLNKSFNIAIFTTICWFYIFYRKFILPFIKVKRKIITKRKQYVQFYSFTEAIKNNKYFIRLCNLFGFLFPLIYMIWDCRNSPHRLSGMAGLIFFFIIMCLFSHKPTNIKWRPVVWGFLLQFIFGVIVLRWEWGASRFIELSDMAILMLDFTYNGTDFTYGFLSSPPNICGMEPIVAFRFLQVIIYVGALVSVLYFYGIIQAVLKRLAWLMQLTMGTTATESLNACSCVLLGNAESPMLIRPYIEKMTSSELHAIMTTGFSCIAGSVFAVFISFGACPRYLLSAAVMGAPGSLACSKLLYPENEESITKGVEDLDLPPSKERNAMECIASGSLEAVHLVTAVIASLISFVAIMALISGIINYCGSLIGHPGWSLEMLFGYAFFPIAYLIGVTESIEQTLIVGRLLGVKIAVSDFIAYKRLGDVLHLLTPRSAMIATYALCSFSNFIAAGVQMSVLSGMSPKKKPLISKLIIRALLAGCISCFVSACIAGILIEDPILCSRTFGTTSGKCFDINEHQLFMEEMIKQRNNSLHN
ncbi:Nucleos_tra2_C domain-containing protein [Meloidogyne graminicola]|uniref:Nucleos_tra2_C domain-containing protein n=1 Tax=Meloidogyne graminicola TaxID=189291 RepID=A0A8S9ZT28_9BILA|nr:Nucleos_tra2_C domain-containing protein [Meloidogyne graminicola]